MKAVIMAGGKGTRLRPLTSNTPKPMMSLLDRPCMEYMIELLKKYNITDIAVTLQYMPKVIRQYFGDGSDWGVQLHYYEENESLGTAGSVKNVEDFLDDTFIVISADAVTDFNLAQAIEFHETKQALGTIVLTRVDSPLEFGVVMTDEQGSIQRFLEKPSWGEVFSDTVNTGIYILQPEILNYIDAGKEFDFSKDLFPLLMANTKPLYGYVAKGYWSDIGNLAQYRQTQYDMLEGKVHLSIHGTELSEGVWMGENVNISADALLKAPCYIGNNSIIESRADIGQYSVIGEGSLVRSGASIGRTVLGKKAFLEREVELIGATLCNNVTVGVGSVIHEGAVLGDRCKVGTKSIIHAGVKIYPNMVIDNHAMINHSFISGETASKLLFGYTGVKGVCNAKMTTGFANRLALAHGSSIKVHSTLAISHDHSPFSSLLAESYASGLHASGIHTCHYGNVTSSVTRHGIKHANNCSGGIMIRKCSSKDDEYIFEFYDETGVSISKALERKIENSYFQEDFRLLSSTRLGKKMDNSEAGEIYRDQMLQLVHTEGIRRMKYKVVVQYDPRNLDQILPELLEKLGCRVILLNNSMFSNEDMAKLIRTYEADLGIVLDSNGRHIELITEKGMVVREEITSLLQLLIQINCENKNTLHVPVYQSDSAEMLAEQYYRQVIRTKADMRTIMQGCEFNGYHLYYDGLYTLVQIIHMMSLRGKNLSNLIDSIPNFTVLKKQVGCPWSEKGKVMRFLMEDTKGKHVELIDGIKVYHDHGWTLILPDCEEPTFQIFSNAGNLRQAEEMVLIYTNKIVDCYRMKTTV